MSKSKNTEPEDIGLKMVSKEEKLWTDVIDGAKRDNENISKAMKVNEAIIEIATQKLEDEKARKIET